MTQLLSVIHTTHRWTQGSMWWMKIGSVVNAIYWGISFGSVCGQPSNSVGQSLSGFEPWETEHIEGDGNCQFDAYLN